MILVTGATGNVGKELVPILLELGQHVKVLTRNPEKAKNFGSEVQVVEGDFERPDTIQSAMSGVDNLFLMIGGIGRDHASAAVEAAQQSGVRKIVLLSSLIADIQEIALGRWHNEREQVVKNSGIPHTILRPGPFMSNALQWAGSIKSQGTVYFPGGQSESAPIDPSDIAAVAAAALTGEDHAGKAYELSGAEVLTSTQMVDTLAKMLGKPIRIVDVPPAAGRDRMIAAGLDAELVDAVLETQEFVRGGLESNVVPTVEQILGRPPLTFKQWCKTHAGAFIGE